MADFIKIGDCIAFRKSAITAIRLIQSKDEVNCTSKTHYSLVVEHVAGANRISDYMGIPDGTDVYQVFLNVLKDLNDEV